MTFRTILNQNEIQKSIKQIDYQSKICLIGSCFVENIGKKLSYYKLNHLINPHGILFNPKAIEKALTDIVEQRVYTKSDLVFENEQWHSLQHHSDFSNTDSSIVLKDINTRILQTKDYLKNTSHFIITLGTAWAYRHIATDQFVANCHKIPQKNFDKHLLSISEITDSLKNSIKLIHKVNPSTQIVLTLSPVRHLKDGMLANSQSKAHLLTAIYKVINNPNIYYFPSYEIQMDDLRDYRFYTSDLLHPNKTAIDYIWNFFKEHWIDSAVFPIMKQVAQIQKGLLHKVFNPDSKQHKVFLKNLEQQQKTLLKSHQIKF